MTTTPDPAGLTEAELDRLDELARAAWPELVVPVETFRAHLARHVRGPSELTELRVSDLYLACACACAVPGAIQAVEARLANDLAHSFARVRPAGMDLSDALQLVRAKLFVPGNGRPPKILDYAGRGELGAWLRVLVVRTLIDAAREHHRINDEVSDDDNFRGFTDAADDPELDYLKRTYRSEFKEAFHAALAALPARDRNVLRFHLVKQLSIDEIGTLLHVHRATAARWITKARQDVIVGTRAQLMQRLKLSPTELDSLVRLIESSIDVSISRVLGAAVQQPES